MVDETKIEAGILCGIDKHCVSICRSYDFYIGSALIVLMSLNLVKIMFSISNILHLYLYHCFKGFKSISIDLITFFLL